ncbi:MAG: cardiolipin synthase [Clostridia bacterium]|nr:cardiolipin synthase [Clostridia bacterium]
MNFSKKPKWFRELLRRRLFFCLLIFVQLAALLFLILNQSRTSVIISHILQLVSIVVAIHIISRRDKEAYKLTWVFFILIFPIFGGLLYLFFFCQTRSKKLLKKTEEIRGLIKAAQPSDSAFAKAAQSMPDRIRQIEYLEKYAGFPIYENECAEYFSPGETFWERLLCDLEQAEKYIFIESFIIEDGEMWNPIFSILKQKASHGVDVRILYDDMGCFLRLPRNFAKELRGYGIQCEVFNRFVPFLSAVQNFRDHRKIVAIDGKIAYTGGLNIADEYINKIHPLGHWKDAGVRIEGESAFGFSLMFLQMWMLLGHNEASLSVYRPEKNSENSKKKKMDGFVQPYSSEPLTSKNVSEEVYMQIISKAKKYVYIETPYLIVDNSMITALTIAAKSGVDIRIMTPFHWDKRFVHFMTRSYYRELIRAGIKIYEYTPGFIHSKIFVCDDEIATVGTANMDFRSLYLQFECGAFFCGSQMVHEVREDFLQTVSLCKEITEEDCRSNAFVRFLQDLFRLFAPLL